MIKKFVSNALLSVFMDKKARETLKAVQEQDEPSAPAASGTNTINDLENLVVQSDPLENLNKDEVADLIRESLDEAEREIVNRKTKRAANPERQALIDQAMAIHRSKQYVVDELPLEQREKLMYMALKTLVDPDDNGNKH